MPRRSQQRSTGPHVPDCPPSFFSRYHGSAACAPVVFLGHEGDAWSSRPEGSGESQQCRAAAGRLTRRGSEPGRPAPPHRDCRRKEVGERKQQRAVCSARFEVDLRHARERRVHHPQPYLGRGSQADRGAPPWVSRLHFMLTLPSAISSMGQASGETPIARLSHPMAAIAILDTSQSEQLPSGMRQFSRLQEDQSGCLEFDAHYSE